MSTNKLKIGLFGFGCVGQGLYDIIDKIDFQTEIVKICVKNRNKKRPIDSNYFTFDKDELLNHSEIQLIVEMIDDAEEAYHIVKAALQKGKNVVTANKKMVAEHLSEFVEIQREHGTSLLYEAAACGSIPIVRNLAEYYDNELLNSVAGIFNGSSNYILTKVIQEKISYQEALKQAQDLGFAETDPTLDVGGFDAKYKLCIITAHSYGYFIKPEEVFNYGIQSLSEYDVEYATEKNYKIKLIANVQRVGNHDITLWIMPQFVPIEHDLYYVENEYNGVIVEAAFSDKQVFIGKGAGGHPTGSAVLSDISANRYDYKYEYKKVGQDRELRYTREKILEVYVRYHNDKDLEIFDFKSIDVKYSGRNFNYVIGTVSLNHLFKISEKLKQSDIFLVNTGKEITQNPISL